MNSKIRFLKEQLKSLNLEGMIISNPINISYLIGIDKSSEGTLLITKKEVIYITDSRYIEAVNNVITIDDEIIVTDVRNISKEEYENFFMFCENVGFEEDYVTYSEYKRIMHTYKVNNLVETEKLIEKQRVIKTEEEIELTRKACELTDDCFKHLLKFIKKGLTEKQIALEIEKYFKENGADDISFEPIVASGKNSSMPHAVPTDKKIESGDIITIDFGCIYKGYCSDMTRTIFVDYVKEEYKKVYDLVLKNQELTLKEYAEGKNSKVITQMVVNDFKINRFDLVHGLGHGTGLEIHELPFVNNRREHILKQNMIVTDEPGIYIPGQFGVRIEDTVLVGKSAGEPLTKSDKGYVVI